MTPWQRGVRGGLVAFGLLFVANTVAASMAYRTPLWLAVFELASPLVGGAVAASGTDRWQTGLKRGAAIAPVLLLGAVFLLILGPFLAAIPGVGLVPGLDQSLVGFSQLTPTALGVALVFLLVVAAVLGGLGGVVRAVFQDSVGR
ncbi:hypothetical protein [Halobacterium wangiae]|uniref:hypothetical protein n=1 Tax=Halobacterium wangiae TaxID=2902623 RepID=UPI001E2C94A4|nr:hypothetical protein [Halobacterium wangiae]